MPWYLTAKVCLLKIWAWCKKYWQLLAGLAIPIVLSLLFRRRGNSDHAREAISQIQEGHQREVTAIDESHRIEREEIQEAQGRHDVTVAAVEAQASAANINLSEKKREEIRNLVEKYENDPSTLTHELSQTTGIAIWTGKSK